MRDITVTQRLLSKEDLAYLANAISEVEKKTSGELRLIIAKRSSLTSHVIPMLAFIFATVSMVYLWQTRHLHMLGDAGWHMPAALGGSFVLAFVLGRLRFIQRRLTWPSDLEHQVLMRAETEFHREGLSNTADKTGILIFLSLFERQAVVLADKGIASKIEKTVWGDVVQIILDGVRQNTLKENLELAIKRCGELLHKQFPIQTGDKNELPNHVIVKE